jgi:GT2 family glycosyltransferase
VTSLSAIVPATNDPPTLERCVAAIRAAEEPPEEILVVDRAAAPGPAAARNEGAGRATGDVLVFVDADVVPHADAFRRIRRGFDGDPALTALFGSYDDAPEAPGLVSTFRNLLHHHVHQDGGGPTSTFWAGLGAVRRDAFAAVGGFDADRYRVPAVEDIDLGLRLCAGGGRIVLDPAVQGTHLKAWSLTEMVRTDFSRRGVPWTELLLRRGAPFTVLNLGWRHRLSALASVAGMAGVATARPRLFGAGIAALLGLNIRFYGLLLRRQGLTHATAGIGLHALHHLTAIAAAATAATRALRRP